MDAILILIDSDAEFSHAPARSSTSYEIRIIQPMSLGWTRKHA